MIVRQGGGLLAVSEPHQNQLFLLEIHGRRRPRDLHQVGDHFLDQIKVDREGSPGV